MKWYSLSLSVKKSDTTISFAGAHWQKDSSESLIPGWLWVTQALLSVGKCKDEKKRRITLKVHEDDVTFALQVPHTPPIPRFSQKIVIWDRQCCNTRTLSGHVLEIVILDFFPLLLQSVRFFRNILSVGAPSSMGA